MTTATIYTIEREFGSAGHIVGERLAKMLGIPFYGFSDRGYGGEKCRCQPQDFRGV